MYHSSSRHPFSRSKSPGRSQGINLYSTFRYRKNAQQHLQLLQNRIHQLQRKELKTQSQAAKSKQIIQQTINKRQQILQKQRQKKLLQQKHQQELNFRKKKNLALKLQTQQRITENQKLLLQERKKYVKQSKIKFLQEKRRATLKPERRYNSVHRAPSVRSGQQRILQKTQIQEERLKKTLQKITQLEQLEKSLIEKLSNSISVKQTFQHRLNFVKNNRNITTSQEIHLFNLNK